MEKVLVVFGPTASGKSSVAIELAKLLNGEVISADSMQIYRDMDIGTAKVTTPEMQGIPHHLINVVDANQKFSVADFKKLAVEAISDILSRGKLPIICGGTGLYIDALIKNISFEEEPEESELRKSLFAEHKAKGNALMHSRLAKLDPDSAAAIHENNTKRVIRALEVTIQSGIPFSLQKERAISNPPEFDFRMFGLAHEREVLYERINFRVDLMFQQGLVEEAKQFMNSHPAATSAQAIGYKELATYFSGAQTLDEATEKIKMETRRYAKRQITWMKRYSDAFWINCMNLSAAEIAAQIIKAF